MKSIYDYTNYRTYLSDFYTEKKATEKYTYRDFSKAVHMNSPSWLPQLISGKRNLTPDSTIRVARAIGLKKRETEYFGLLVQFTQAATSDAKDFFYQKILGFKKKLGMARIDEKQYRFFSQWYYPVLWSLVTQFDFKGDWALLAKKLEPSITPREAEKAVGDMESIGLLVKNEQGRYVQSSSVISTGDEVNSLSVKKHHKQVMKLGEGAYDRSSREWRDISALVLGINKKEWPKVKKAVQTFRKTLLEMAETSEDPDSVYQVSFQLYPVTRMEES